MRRSCQDGNAGRRDAMKRGGSGQKIGELEAVYVDTGIDLPSFGTVKVGMPTRHRLVFVL